MEGKTVPIFNTSLSAGYTFIDRKDRDTGETLQNPFPRQIVKVGIHYDDVQHSFRGALLGRYVCGNSNGSTNAKSSAMSSGTSTWRRRCLQVVTWRWSSFSTPTTSSTAPRIPWTTAFKNARRWVEGGIKFNF